MVTAPARNAPAATPVRQRGATGLGRVGPILDSRFRSQVPGSWTWNLEPGTWKEVASGGQRRNAGHHSQRRGQFLELQPRPQICNCVVGAGLAGNLLNLTL